MQFDGWDGCKVFGALFIQVRCKNVRASLFLASLSLSGELSWSLAIGVADNGVVLVALVANALGDLTAHCLVAVVGQDTQVGLAAERRQVSVLELGLALDGAVGANDTFKIVTEH